MINVLVVLLHAPDVNIKVSIQRKFLSIRQVSGSTATMCSWFAFFVSHLYFFLRGVLCHAEGAKYIIVFHSLSSTLSFHNVPCNNTLCNDEILVSIISDCNQHKQTQSAWSWIKLASSLCVCLCVGRGKTERKDFVINKQVSHFTLFTSIILCDANSMKFDSQTSTLMQPSFPSLVCVSFDGCVKWKVCLCRVPSAMLFRLTPHASRWKMHVWTKTNHKHNDGIV